MFADREIPLRTKKSDLMTSIKNSSHAVLSPSRRVARLKCGKESISFLFMRQYLDLNSQSLIAETWVWENEVPEGVVTEVSISEGELKWWRENLPAMAERCRDYPHLEGCGYTSERESHHSAAAAKEN